MPLGVASLVPEQLLTGEVCVSPATVGEEQGCRSFRLNTPSNGVITADEDALKRAMRRKSARNLDASAALPSSSSKFSNSFLAFSDHDIASKVSKVGISLVARLSNWIFL